MAMVLIISQRKALELNPKIGVKENQKLKFFYSYCCLYCPFVLIYMEGRMLFIKELEDEFTSELQTLVIGNTHECPHIQQMRTDTIPEFGVYT